MRIYIWMMECRFDGQQPCARCIRMWIYTYFYVYVYLYFNVHPYMSSFMYTHSTIRVLDI